MAVASTATTTYTRDELLRAGARSAGLLNAAEDLTPEQLSFGGVMLWAELQALQARGLVFRAYDRTSVALVTSQAYVDMPSDTLTVEQGIVCNGTDGTALPLGMYNAEQYQRQPVKTTTGRPLYAYPEERSTGAWRLYLWPVPDGNWPTIVVPRTRRLADVNAGGVNVDLDPKWTRAILIVIAAIYADHFGQQTRAQAFRSRFEEELSTLISDDGPKGDWQLVVTPLW